MWFHILYLPDTFSPAVPTPRNLRPIVDGWDYLGALSLFALVSDLFHGHLDKVLMCTGRANPAP